MGDSVNPEVQKPMTAYTHLSKFYNEFTKFQLSRIQVENCYLSVIKHIAEGMYKSIKIRSRNLEKKYRLKVTLTPPNDRLKKNKYFYSY